MASSSKNLSQHSGKNIGDMHDKKFAVVVSEWNEEVTASLFNGVVETLLKHGVTREILSGKMFQAHLN